MSIYFNEKEEDLLDVAFEKVEELEKELTLAQKNKDKSRERVLSSYLGETHWRMGDPDVSIEYFENALTISREIKDRVHEAFYLGKIADIYLTSWRRPDQLLKSADCNEQALIIAQEIGDRSDECVRIGSLITIYNLLGDIKKCIDYSLKGLVLVRDIKDRSSEGGLLLNLSVAYRKLGDEKKANELKKQGDSILKELGISLLDEFNRMFESNDYESKIMTQTILNYTSKF